MTTSNSDQIMAYNELCTSLPMIIMSDHDEGTKTKRRSSVSIVNNNNAPSATTSNQAMQTYASQQQWTTGFTNFTDEMWSRMKSDVKQKLRDACVEVLKRTDDTPVGDKMSWKYDEDARFLD